VSHRFRSVTDQPGEENSLTAKKIEGADDGSARSGKKKNDRGVAGR